MSVKNETEFDSSDDGGYVDVAVEDIVYESHNVKTDSPTSLGGADAILYAPMGSMCRRDFHAALTMFIQNGSLKRYIWRPTVLQKCSFGPNQNCRSFRRMKIWEDNATDEPFFLSGFGVEMSIKNMEYKAIDDQTQKRVDRPEQGKETDTADSLDMVTDTMDVLKSRKEARIEKPLYLTKSVEESKMSMKVIDDLVDHDANGPVILENNDEHKDLDDIGLKVYNRVMQFAKSKDISTSKIEVLRYLQKISSNFPNVSARIAQDSPPPRDVRDAIDQIQDNLIPGGANILAINKRPVNAMSSNDVKGNSNMIDVFKLVEVIHDEIRVNTEIVTGIVGRLSQKKRFRWTQKDN